MLQLASSKLHGPYKQGTRQPLHIAIFSPPKSLPNLYSLSSTSQIRSEKPFNNPQTPFLLFNDSEMPFALCPVNLHKKSRLMEPCVSTLCGFSYSLIAPIQSSTREWKDSKHEACFATQPIPAKARGTSSHATCATDFFSFFFFCG